MLNVVMLNVIMLSVVILNVIMLSVVRLNVIMLSVVRLNVVMLSVVMLNVMPSGQEPSPEAPESCIILLRPYLQALDQDGNSCN